MREHSANASHFYSAAARSNTGHSNQFSCFYSVVKENFGTVPVSVNRPRSVQSN